MVDATDAVEYRESAPATGAAPNGRRRRAPTQKARRATHPSNGQQETAHDLVATPADARTNRIGRLAVIGGGKMGGAITARVVQTGLLPPERVVVSEINEGMREGLRSRLGVRTVADNRAALDGASTILLALTPQVLPAVMDELRGHLHLDQLVISIAAGVELRTLEMGLRHAAIVRVMPNTPAQVGESFSAWMATDEVTPAQKAGARGILQSFGRELEVEQERHLDMVTALSGSGPAWVMLFLEALTDAGVQIGLKRDWAYDLALQTISGSITLARETKKHPAELRNMVTTPGGTTAAGLYEMERGGLRGVIAAGIVAAYERCVALGEAARRQ